MHTRMHAHTHACTHTHTHTHKNIHMHIPVASSYMVYTQFTYSLQKIPNKISSVYVCMYIYRHDNYIDNEKIIMLCYCSY